MADKDGYSDEGRSFVARRMREFAAGTMKGSDEKRVEDRSQALAIAHSEAKEKGLAVPERG